MALVNIVHFYNAFKEPLGTRVELSARSAHDAKGDPKRALVWSCSGSLADFRKARWHALQIPFFCVQAGRLRELLGWFGVPWLRPRSACGDCLRVRALLRIGERPRLISGVMGVRGGALCHSLWSVRFRS